MIEREPVVAAVNGAGKVAVRLRDVGKTFRRVAAGYPFRTLKSALVDRSLVRDAPTARDLCSKKTPS